MSAFTFKFKRKDRDKSLVQIGPDRIIDSAILFQPLFVVSRSEALSFKEVLTYELSPYPPALFETWTILRKLDKPQLAQANRDHATGLSSEAVINSIHKRDCYVLECVSLLHHLPRKKDDSCNAIDK